LTDENRNLAIMDIPKLIYRFIDSSVPPAYHRSYTITVKPQSVEFTVDCYGDILAEYKLNLCEKVFQDFLTQLRRIEISGIEPDDDKGCAGGKTDSFDLILDDVALKGYVYHCAGKRYGNLSGNTDDAARLFRELVPGLTSKLRV